MWIDLDAYHNRTDRSHGVMVRASAVINCVFNGICSVPTSWLMTMAEWKPINGIQI